MASATRLSPGDPGSPAAAILWALDRTASESEIASAAKNERAVLKTYAADLALKMAEEKLRGQLNSQADAGLIQGFLKEIALNPREGFALLGKADAIETG